MLRRLSVLLQGHPLFLTFRLLFPAGSWLSLWEPPLDPLHSLCSVGLRILSPSITDYICPLGPHQFSFLVYQPFLATLDFRDHPTLRAPGPCQHLHLYTPATKHLSFQAWLTLPAEFESRCAVSVKYTSDFSCLIRKKECKVLH